MGTPSGFKIGHERAADYVCTVYTYIIYMCTVYIFDCMYTYIYIYICSRPCHPPLPRPMGWIRPLPPVVMDVVVGGGILPLPGCGGGGW